MILKATEKCNANCYYCDVVRKEHTGTSMSLEVLEKVFELIDEYMLAQPEEQVEILWHGGEPLLLGPQYFRTALEFQNWHCGRTKSRIRHAMQTNLMCFTEEFVERISGSRFVPLLFSSCSLPLFHHSV